MAVVNGRMSEVESGGIERRVKLADVEVDSLGQAAVQLFPVFPSPLFAPSIEQRRGSATPLLVFDQVIKRSILF